MYPGCFGIVKSDCEIKVTSQIIKGVQGIAK